jgi:hypothetical protein
LVNVGERNFKLIAINDSEKSEKVMIEFGKIFGKELEPEIQTIKDERRR